MVQETPSTSFPLTGGPPVAGAGACAAAIMGTGDSGSILSRILFGRTTRLVEETRFTARDLGFFTRRYHLRKYLSAGVGVGAPPMPRVPRWRRFLRRWRRSAPTAWRSRSCASARLRGAAATAAAALPPPRRVRCAPVWRRPASPARSPFRQEHGFRRAPAAARREPALTARQIPAAAGATTRRRLGMPQRGRGPASP